MPKSLSSIFVHIDHHQQHNHPNSINKKEINIGNRVQVTSHENPHKFSINHTKSTTFTTAFSYLALISSAKDCQKIIIAGENNGQNNGNKSIQHKQLNPRRKIKQFCFFDKLKAPGKCKIKGLQN